MELEGIYVYWKINDDITEGNNWRYNDFIFNRILKLYSQTVYYVWNISNIVKSTEMKQDKRIKERIIYIIKNKRVMENFKMIKLKELEEIIISLLKKKGTERE